jgi:hypothetical protein
VVGAVGCKGRPAARRSRGLDVLTTFDLDAYVYGALRAAADRRARLLDKLSARDRARLVITACETGLVAPAPR